MTCFYPSRIRTCDHLRIFYIRYVENLPIETGSHGLSSAYVLVGDNDRLQLNSSSKFLKKVCACIRFNLQQNQNYHDKTMNAKFETICKTQK